MSRSVTLSYRWDAKTCMTAAEAAYRHRLRHSPVRFAGWLFIALTQFGVVAALKQGSVALLLLGTLLTLYWYVLRWPLRRAALRRKCAKRGEDAVTLKADAAGLHTGDALVAWDAVNSVIAMTPGFLVNLERDYLFFPRPAFGDAGTAAAFAELARTRCGAYREEE